MVIIALLEPLEGAHPTGCFGNMLGEAVVISQTP